MNGFDDDVGKARRDHPDTAHEAARMILPRSGTLRRKVYDFIVDQGYYGATDDGIRAHRSMIGNTERPRRVELVDESLIRDSGVRRVSQGRRRIVWVAVYEDELEEETNG